MTLTYVAHPANYDREEDFAIIFRGPDDGPIYDGPGTEATDFFTADAAKIARLIACMATKTWREAFRAAYNDACDVVDDYFSEASDDEATIEAFIGEPIETLDGDVIVRTGVELAS